MYQVPRKTLADGTVGYQSPWTNEYVRPDWVFDNHVGRYVAPGTAKHPYPAYGVYREDLNGWYVPNYYFYIGTRANYVALDCVYTNIPRPVGEDWVYDRGSGVWAKPGQDYIDGVWWKSDDPNKPEKVLTLADLGLALTISNLGCGTYNMYGFNFSGRYKPAEAIRAISAALNPYRSGTTGIILAVLNPDQNPRYKPILEACGFVLLSTYTNYAHDHNNYLYGFLCMDHKPIIKEKGRAFG